MTSRLFPFLLLASIGCSGSRWAKDDLDYAAKYPKHTDDVGRTIKQAIDARHLVNKGGWYAAVQGSDDPTAMGAEAGIYRYPNPYTEGRIGLAGLIYDGDDPLSGGVLAAARLQTPTRLAPFVGMGVYAGLTPERSLNYDSLDNDHDTYIDEGDETKNDFVLAMVPEAGCHFWLTPGWRLTGSTSYYVTGTGADDNILMFGVSLACMTDLGKITSPRTLRKMARDGGWKVGDGLEPQSQDFVPSENAPSEPLVQPTNYLSEEPVEMLSDDRELRQTAYDALPASQSLITTQ